MNIDSRIAYLRKEIELNLSAMYNQRMSNERFCMLVDENAVMFNQLTDLYKIKNQEIDKKMEEFQKEAYK